MFLFSNMDKVNALNVRTSAPILSAALGLFKSLYKIFPHKRYLYIVNRPE